MRILHWKNLLALSLVLISSLKTYSIHSSQTTIDYLSGGDRHTKPLSLNAGMYVSVRVEQEGVDVVVALRAPDGKLLAEVNRPIGAHGPEFLHGIAEDSGLYVVEIRAANQTAEKGQYTLTITEPRSVQPTDKLLVAAQRALNQGRDLRAAGLKAQLESAVTAFDSAARDFKAAGEFTGAADALIEKGRAVHFLGNSMAAADCFQEARTLYQRIGDRHGEALAIYRFGGTAKERKLEHYRPALDLALASGNRFITAKCLYYIGHETGVGGNHNEGIPMVRESVEILRALGYRYDEADTLLSLGWMLNDVGDLQQGMAEYQKALRLHREDKNRRELANALLFVADGWLLLGDAERARDAVTESLDIARAGGHQLVEILALLKFSDVCLRLDQPLQALRQLEQALSLAEKADYQTLRILKGLGQTSLTLGNPAQALEYLNRAFGLYQAQGAVSGRADVNFYIAQAYQRLGQTQKAMGEFDRTLADFRQRDERLGVARTLIAQSGLRASMGEPVAARERNEAALAVLASLRQGLSGYSTRATFSATLAEAYTQQIDLLMRQSPSAEQIREAFALSERARARSLLERVNEARVTHDAEADASLLRELREAQQRLNDEALRRLSESSGNAPTDARLRERSAEVEALRARLRVTHPRYASLTHPQTLDAAAAQRLLDSDSALIEYALGEEASYVWFVTAGEITGYKLPKRAELESAARAFHQALSANKPYQAQAAALSRLVLGPLADRLQKRRLLIVADGALQYVPFAALRLPGKAAQPLIAEHEIVNLPSASVLAVLRREFGARPAAARSVAVFADPVFSRDDARVNASLAKNTPPAPEARRGANDLRRLITTADEADVILSLAPQGSAFQLRGFQATRDSVLRTDLASYRILHFATHGWLEDAHPDLSWLALSMVDEQGQPRDGFLRLHEIYNLKLNADLVVMSACQTALGREIKGEGLIGLTRGFMYAGAPRVVASLWQVNSAATAELMKRFYRGMFCENARPAAALPAKGLVKQTRKSSPCENLPPAAALRAAQLELHQRGLSPYYWGGFVLQGEWR